MSSTPTRLVLRASLLASLVSCGATDPGSPVPGEIAPNAPPTGEVVIEGVPRVGAELRLTSTLADADGLGVLVYRWIRDGVAIEGATRDRYTVQRADVGASLRVQVDYVDGRNAKETVLSGPTILVPSGGSLDPAHPNILLIVADDQGVDASNQYAFSNDRPRTPTLDSLANTGIVFENVWATPACTTTRGTMMTGKHGVHSGLTFVPAVMSTTIETLPRYLRAQPTTAMYRMAVVGKWHLGGANPANSHPNDSGVDYYAGTITGVLPDYFNWPLVQNGQQSTSTRYHTSHITDLSIAWATGQSSPWVLWLTYAAPHAPFHLPPATLHSRTDLSGTSADLAARPRAYYLAAIEAMDAEIGRLLAALPADVRANTLVLFVGDNGTPAPIIDRSVFPAGHAKNSLYEGGIRVPMLVSGAGVTRRGVRDAALINTTDVFSTIAHAAGGTALSAHDSFSFTALLGAGGVAPRRFNYSEFESDEVSGWVVRDARYKLIQLSSGAQRLYDLSTDLAEQHDLLAGSNAYAGIAAELKAEGDRVRAAPRSP